MFAERKLLSPAPPVAEHVSTRTVPMSEVTEGGVPSMIRRSLDSWYV